MFKNEKIHMIGIGGISMSGIAMMAKNLGAIVSGSDANKSEMINMLLSNNIQVTIGHDATLIDYCDIVIYSSAIPENDIEFSRAKELGKVLYERSEFLGLLSKQYDRTICISGTHGKSTTTGLISSVFLETEFDPTIQIGAILPEINGNIKIGGNSHLIMEACEYKNSFLDFFPTDIIITNIELDHIDFFKDLNDFKNSFQKYINLLPDDGILTINNDDENSTSLDLSKIHNLITYGINNNADFIAKNIIYNEYGYPSFDIYSSTKLIHIDLNIPGLHNVYNSLAVFALSSKYISNFELIKKGLEKYRGVGRRFEYIGTYNNALIYDDYAHHPTEIETTYNTVKTMNNKRSIAIFQSHTYSRTNEFMNEFAEILKKFDYIIIAPIYPAREENIFNVKEETLVNLIEKDNKNVIYLDSYDKILSHLKKIVQNEDLIITIGAGPINEVANQLKNADN